MRERIVSEGARESWNVGILLSTGSREEALAELPNGSLL